MTEPRTQSELSDSLARSEAREADSRRLAFEAGAWLAAIVENSEDAILSKTLDGIIMSWNAGAEKLFGYTAEEAIGQPITLIIPEDRRHEEDEIIRRLRQGKRVDHFETVRRRKDGKLVDIALTVSPVRDEAGNVLGASKIARDISAAKHAAAQQDLVIREMNHRIKNLFALATSLVALSARGASDVDALTEDLTSRLQSLSRAHALILPDFTDDASGDSATTLRAVLQEVLAPHDDAIGSRISIEGDEVPVGHHSVATLGLLFHELATNAAKYGGLSSEKSRLSVRISLSGESAEIRWCETGGPKRDEDAPLAHGFGSSLEQASVKALRGTLERSWRDRGLEILLTIPVAQLAR
jgi:PAS domain S-box-containing protein